MRMTSWNGKMIVVGDFNPKAMEWSETRKKKNYFVKGNISTFRRGNSQFSIDVTFVSENNSNEI